MFKVRTETHIPDFVGLRLNINMQHKGANKINKCVTKKLIVTKFGNGAFTSGVRIAKIAPIDQ
jgi:hypothetical protein